MVRLVLCLVLMAGLCSSASGQLFPNAPWNKPVGVSDCLNGQCPAPAQQAPEVESRFPVASAVIQAQPVRSVAKAVAQAQPVRTVAKAVFSTVTGRRTRSYGCTGSTSYGSTGSMAWDFSTHGVGYGFDVDGALITSVGPAYVVAPNTDSEVSSLGIRKRRASREVILEAAQKAHDACTIDSDQLRAIKLAARSPRMLARMEDLILEKAQSSGAYSFTLDANGDPVKALVDWEAIGDFILKIAPLIFKLIEMFALDTSPDAGVMFAEAVGDHLPNFIATRQDYVLLTAA